MRHYNSQLQCTLVQYIDYKGRSIVFFSIHLYWSTDTEFGLRLVHFILLTKKCCFAMTHCLHDDMEMNDTKVLMKCHDIHAYLLSCDIYNYEEEKAKF